MTEQQPTPEFTPTPAEDIGFNGDALDPTVGAPLADVAEEVKKTASAK
jgi:hypothetical protein